MNRFREITWVSATLFAALLQGQSAPSPDALASTSPTPVSHVAFGKDGLLATTSDGASQLRVHGYIQGDGRFFSSDLQGQSPEVFLFRRIRPLFEGTLFNTLDFRFMPDFGQNKPQIQEAYVELKSFSPAKLRIGKFKTPVGLEALRSDREGTFVERSLASDLVPLREVGAQIGGSVLANSITYAAGYFNGATDGSNGNFQWRQSNEGAARVFLQPFTMSHAPPLRQLGIGMAGSFAHEHGALPKFKTVGQNTFFKYSSTAIADGPHNRVSPQAYYYFGPFGILGEYTVSSQEVRNNLNSRQLTNSAWQVAGSFVLTREKNTYAGVKPTRAFEPNKGLRYIGGWEIAARYSQLRIDPNAFPLFADASHMPKRASERAIGVNWYLNRYAKFMTDFEHTSFEMSPGAFPLHSENLIMCRVQLAF